RASPSPAVSSAFGEWFRRVHLADAGRIPGIVRVQAGRTPAGTYLGLYTFADSDIVQAALASPEAAYARGTWEQWAGELQELTIEILAPLFPLPIYESRS